MAAGDQRQLIMQMIGDKSIWWLVMGGLYYYVIPISG